MELTIFGDILLWSLTFSFVGKVLIAITVINVHAHIVKEHSIDMNVLTYMKKEKVYGLLGIFFITLGYILELSFLNYLPF